MRWLLLAVLMTGCYVPISEEQRPCPCATGWRCCRDENRCVRESEACRPPFLANPTLTAIQKGQALDLGVFRCESPADESPGQCHSVVDGATLLYDRRHHRFFMLGQGNTQVDSLFSFSPDTLQWQALYEPTTCAHRTAANYDEVNGAWRSGATISPRPIMNAPQDTFLALPALGELALFRRSGIVKLECSTRVPDFYGTVAHFSVDDGGWSFSTEQGDGPAALHSFEWDSQSQQVVSLGQDGLSLYDVHTRKWRRVLSGSDLAGPLSYSQELVYSSKTDRFFYFQTASQKLYALTLNRDDVVNSTFQEVATTGPYPSGGAAFVEASGLLVGSIHGGSASLFDPVTSTFTTALIGDGGVGDGQWHSVAYDAVNDVVVFLSDYSSGYHTWVWRLP